MRSVAVYGLAGGFAAGVRRGGGDLVAAVEPGFGRPLFELNHPDVPYLNLTYQKLYAEVPPDFQFGCPPCAGWSTASAGLDRRHNPEHEVNDGIRFWFNEVEQLRPTVACFESVLGCLRQGRPLWGPLARRLEEVGYRWSFVVYDNRQVGVPQCRERMLFWAWRNGGEFVPELPVGDATLTTGQVLSVGSGQRDMQDFWWAHQPMDPDHVPVHRLLPHVMPGSNVRRVPVEVWLEHYHEPGVREGWPSFTYRRLHPDRPAPVMMANALSTIVHWNDPRWPGVGWDPAHEEEVWRTNDKCRLITGRELAILMGYPDDFQLEFVAGEWPASRRHREQLSAWLTQAVSPRVGSWAATCAGVHLEDPGEQGTWQPLVWDLRQGNHSPQDLDNWAPL